MPGLDGANEFTAAELEELFSDELQSETPPTEKETEPQKETEEKTIEQVSSDVDKTKAFAKRLRESTDKARQEEREAIAKSLGFQSYDELQKSRETKIFEDKGLDPTQASEAIEELVKKRIEDDPRMKELDELRKLRVKEFGEKELAELSKLTNGEITKFSQLSKEVIELWTKKGSLKAAYMELEGEKLINKIRSEQSKGSTSHLTNPSGVNGTVTKRQLTAEERKVWKQFNPRMTDEELNKIMVDIK
jgi:hypothetical protein